MYYLKVRLIGQNGFPLSYFLHFISSTSIDIVDQTSIELCIVKAI